MIKKAKATKWLGRRKSTSKNEPDSRGGDRPEATDELFQQVLDAISDFVLVKGPKSKILWANRAFREFYGMSMEQLKGIIDAPTTDPDYTQQYVRDDLYVFENAKKLDVPDEPVQKYDGQIGYFHTVKTPIFDTEGTVVMTVGVSRDITERKKQETLMEEHRQQMLAASKMSALGEMAAGIAHEINNPLAIIHAKSSQLIELAEAEALDPETVLRHARKIEETTLRISRIVKSLRAFARDGEQDPFAVVTTQSIVDDTIEYCRLRFDKAGVELRIDPVPQNLLIECRAVQLSQVLLNLFNNAFDAVEFSAEKIVRLQVRDLGDSVEFRVTDTGSGISKEIRDKIMQPFFTTKETGRGTGLGLSVSRGILESHGGRLWLEADQRQTCFVFRLPKNQTTTLVRVS